MTNQTVLLKTDVKYDWLHVSCTEIRLVTTAVTMAVPWKLTAASCGAAKFTKTHANFKGGIEQPAPRGKIGGSNKGTNRPRLILLESPGMKTNLKL
uniref:Uncharacterized protein n=1 Tax=Romanomermis culicivorax TaxID=13658 RepID=A0A915KVN3_ROMCU